MCAECTHAVSVRMHCRTAPRPVARGKQPRRQKDYVQVRAYAKRGSTCVIATISTTHPSYPEDQYARGRRGPGGFLLTPVEDQANTTQIVWVLSAEARGWLAKYRADNNNIRILVGFYEALRLHLQQEQGGVYKDPHQRRKQKGFA